MTPYKLRFRFILDDWLASKPDTGTRTRVEAWLYELLADPFAVPAAAVPNIIGGLAVRTATVPYTDVRVTFSIASHDAYGDRAGVYLVAIS